MNKLERMKELIPILNEAAKAYYQSGEEIMSNYEYDKLYDELLALEEELGTTLSDSPTVRVGYEVISSLPKVAHDAPMLSLNKTKDPLELQAWIGSNTGNLSWKMDGLTIVLTYENGELMRAATRGNGEIGEIITNNARMFKNIPMRIPYTGKLVLRGEAVISYKDFEKINELIEDPSEKYKNPRNLCSGSVRQLNNEITKNRNVYFIAFALVEGEGLDFMNSRKRQMEILKEMGFDTVESKVVTAENILDAIEDYKSKIDKNEFPSDGLVLNLDDIEYSRSLGRTSKYPRDAIAFKWQDEVALATLLEIEWSASRTGLINPVAIFTPVELEGTTVSRASVHNISILEELELGIGDEVEVYKANMIIPQIAENNTRSGNVQIPEYCPACGQPTCIDNANGSKTLICKNSQCPAKRIKAFEHFVSRECMDIEGLSESTLEKFVDRGFIREFKDIYHISDYREKIVEMEGFGEKSYENLYNAIERSRDVDGFKFLNSLGIGNVGLQTAKVICRFFDDDFEKIEKASAEELTAIDTIGPVIGKTVYEFFKNEGTYRQYRELMAELRIKKSEQINTASSISGKSFVITGSLTHYVNRDELKAFIESMGGKVIGSVSSKTDYLINNDIQSNSSKNKKAKDLNIPIISEEDFLNLVNGN